MSNRRDLGHLLEPDQIVETAFVLDIDDHADTVLLADLDVGDRDLSILSVLSFEETDFLALFVQVFDVVDSEHTVFTASHEALILMESKCRDLIWMLL